MTLLPKPLIASIVCAMSAGHAYSSEMTLDDVLARANADTADRIIIEQTYQAGMADVDVVASSALPIVTTDIGANRLSLSTLGSSASSSSLGTSYGLQSSSQPDIPDRVYGNSYNWGVNMRTPVFAFGKIGTLWDIKNEHEDMLATSRRAQIQQYYLSVVQAYSNALLNLNRLEAAKRSESHAKAVADFTNIEYEGGGRSQVDNLRAKSFASLAIAERQRSEVRYVNSLEHLKQLIGIPPETAINLKPGIHADLAFLNIDKSKRSERLDIKLKGMESSLNNLWADYRDADVWPTLYFTSGLNHTLSKVDYGSFTTNEDVPPSDVFAAGRLNYSVGLALSWTLFDGFRTPAEAHKARAQAIKARTELEKMEREDTSDKREADENVRVAELVLQAAVDAEKASRLAFEQVSSDYKAGTTTLSDMLEIQKDLSETENQLFEAYANKLMSFANYKWIHGIKIKGESPQ